MVKIPEKFRLHCTGHHSIRVTSHRQEWPGGGRYGGDAVQFDPGSSGVHILDPDTLEHKTSSISELVRVVKVAEMLPQYVAQSTAIVCNEVPKATGDLYRLYIVFLLFTKPIVTRSFSAQTLPVMFDRLTLFAGGRQALAEKH